MTIGKSVRDQGGEAPAGGARGIRADGELEGSSYNPLGNPGVEHWQATYVTRDGLGDRSNVFFAAIEMTRMPMIITDPRQPDNPIVFANGAFQDLTGYTEAQLLGRNCRFLQGEATNRDTVAEIRRGIEEQRAVAVDILNYKADGTAFWNGLYMGPVFDAGGALLYYFASQLDITDKFNAHQSSIQSQKMEAIGALTAGLAHDFNNLLHIATGNLEMATRELHGSDVAVLALERSRNALEKAVRLTQQLLTFARKQNLNPQAVSLNQAVLALSDMVAPTLASSTSLRLELGTNLPKCQVDPDHLESALLNLLVNAQEAMPDGGQITVSTAMVALPGGRGGSPRSYVEVAIRDEGTGMSEETVRRATEPFFTTKGPGTGLGLAMVHGFAEQSQGKLHIASAPGQGATVALRFPVATPAEAPAKVDSGAPRTEPQSGHAQHRSRWRARRILVVDDNPDIRTLTTAFLGSLGYVVDTASSGEAALAFLAQGHVVDLMFTDIVMPGGMSGIELAQQAYRQYPQMKLLAATGYMDRLPTPTEPALPLEIVPKPFRFDMLEEKIRQLVQ
ncbi:MAG: ATP-binding protein [Duganella sp.]